MRAIRIHRYGGPEVIQFEDVATPAPGPGQVLVRIAAASVNFLDIQKRRGELVGQAFYHRAMSAGEPEFPSTLGSQGVGTVESVGPDVTNYAPGDRVSFAGNSYATHAIVPAVRLVRIPADLTFEQAAAGMNQGFLAYVFTHFTYSVKPDDWCLVHAAAGGIGLLLCQMAKIRQAKVIGVTSNPDKSPAILDAGADAVIVSSQSDIAKEARRITDNRGVQVVYDGTGKDTFQSSLDSLAPAGYLVIYGQSSGYIPPFDLMALQEKGSLFLTRTNGLPWLKEYPSYLQQLPAWLREKKLTIHVARTYPLAEAAQAQSAFERREVVGRLLLIP
jgi:NADPH2:quinone reductase